MVARSGQLEWFRKYPTAITERSASANTLQVISTAAAESAAAVEMTEFGWSSKLTEEEFLVAEFFDCVAEFGGFFEFEFFGGFAHVGF